MYISISETCFIEDHCRRPLSKRAATLRHPPPPHTHSQLNLDLQAPPIWTPLHPSSLVCIVSAPPEREGMEDGEPQLNPSMHTTCGCDTNTLAKAT